MPAARLTPDNNEARSDLWISSRAYFDGFICQVERVPFDLSRHNMYEIPSDIYREFDEQKREIERNKKEVDNIKKEMRKFREEMNVQPVRQENKETVKFNLEANAEINFSFKLSSFDFAVDITDDAEVRGSPYKAFEMLPCYFLNLEQKNEGTVTRIKIDDKRVFEMLFIAIGALIRIFLNYLLPVLMIDVAHLKGLYKGTNLVAVVMDGNNQIVPIAFGICKWETGPCWSWWMSVLKEFIGDNPNLLFISDRHPAIAMTVENEFPLAFHAAYTREDYATSMNILQIVQPDAYEKLCRAGPQRWSRAHCPLVRYNYMTSNSVESVNACSVIYRKEPVLKLAGTYRVMVQEWYYKRRQLAANMMHEITDWAAHKVAKKDENCDMGC
ncbi:transposase, MuDR, MULE transposase domain protein [Tanacetum coccineum]